MGASMGVDENLKRMMEAMLATDSIKNQHPPVVDELTNILSRNPATIRDRELDFLRNLLRDHIVYKPKDGNDTESDSDDGGGASAFGRALAKEVDYLRFPVPTHWSRDLLLGLNDYRLNLVHPASAEFKRVSDAFHASIPRVGEASMYSMPGNGSRTKCSVFKILRIEDLKQWIQYSIEKAAMREKRGENDINEKHLFHGTRDKEVIDGIIRNGFAKQLIHTHVWGKGLYFSPFASFSYDYTSSGHQPNWAYGQFGMEQNLKDFADSITKTRFMFYCRVICGKIQQPRGSNPDLERPTDGSDSTFSGSPNQIHCIFSHTLVYPEYIIFFQDGGHGLSDDKLFLQYPRTPTSTLVYDEGQSDLNVNPREISFSLTNAPLTREYNLT